MLLVGEKINKTRFTFAQQDNIINEFIVCFFIKKNSILLKI